MTSNTIPRRSASKRSHRMRIGFIKQQSAYLTMLIPGLILLFLFCYLPMPGVILAFKKYRLAVPPKDFWIQNKFIYSLFFNLMHSDTTLVNRMLYGVEGTHWAFAEDGRVNLLDTAWNGSIGGAWTVGNTAIQAVTTSEDPAKNEMLQRYADDAVAHPSLGFRFVQDPVAGEIAAMTNIALEYCAALRVGAADPDDPQVGVAALNAALEAAGIDAVLAELQAQYDAWKATK